MLRLTWLMAHFVTSGVQCPHKPPVSLVSDGIGASETDITLAGA
jgi:hypothetical protein